MHPNNIVTGLIKGTGIANLFIIKDDNLDGKITYEGKKARDFYTKSKRIYETYNDFPIPLAQIFWAKKVTANKLLKFKNDCIFEDFVKDIKVVVNRNYNTYNYQSNSLKLFEESHNIGGTISNDIIDEVLRYAKNPSISIKEQITVNPLFKKLNFS